MDRRSFALGLAAIAGCGTGMLAGCSAQEAPSAPALPVSARAPGRLSGKVTRGPKCPGPARIGEECTEPASGAVLVVRTPSGQEAARATADARGAYSVPLSPGRYRVEIESLTGMEFTKSLPAEITITSGEDAQLDVVIDTGMR